MMWKESSVRNHERYVLQRLEGPLVLSSRDLLELVIPNLDTAAARSRDTTDP